MTSFLRFPYQAQKRNSLNERYIYNWAGQHFWALKFLTQHSSGIACVFVAYISCSQLLWYNLISVLCGLSQTNNILTNYTSPI